MPLEINDSLAAELLKKQGQLKLVLGFLDDEVVFGNDESIEGTLPIDDDESSGSGIIVAPDSDLPPVGNLIAHYKLDESSGLVITNEQGANGTLVSPSNITWNPTGGQLNGCLERISGGHITSPSEYGNLNQRFSDVFNDSFSISCLIKLSDTSTSLTCPFGVAYDHVTNNWSSVRLFTGEGNEYAHFQYLSNDNKVEAITSNGELPNDGNFHHVVGVVDNDSEEIKIYIDKLIPSLSVSSVLDFSTNNVVMADYFNDNINAYLMAQNNRGFGAYDLFSGSIDDLRIYDIALNLTQITAIYDLYGF